MSIFSFRSNSTVLRAYNDLSKVQSSLNSNIERLSSGLRINSASDDSAGSSVAVRMVNQINGMKQANANVQQANNLLATAESGLSDISDILSKMRELSVQASTDTLNDADRASIDLEFQSLKDELTRIANVTEYNGMNVLNGTYQTDVYDQAQPGTSESSDPHGTAGPASVNVDGPSDNIRGHWRLQVGADNDINNQHEFSLTNATANGLDLEEDNVLSVDEARTAITAIDHAIDEVNRERSYIGSEQNKLQFTISNLSNYTQAIEAGRSSIADVDFALEATELAKNQILAQSGTAMLAQASVVSQNVLALLM